MPADKFNFPKLKGEENYPTQCIRGEAHLITQGYIDDLEDIIKEVGPESSSVFGSSIGTSSPVFQSKPPTSDRSKKDKRGLAALKLIVKDGPLSYIKRAKNLGEAWLILKSFYNKEGFLAIFIIIKKFIRIKCLKIGVSSYPNEIQTLINNLEAKGVTLPETFVNTWVLERLERSFDDFKTLIYSTLRDIASAYTLEQLSSHIIDKFKRRQSISNSLDKEKALTTSKKRKWKQSKGHQCKQCKVTSHNTDKCWILHSTLRPKRAKTEKGNGTDKVNNPEKSGKNSSTKGIQPKGKKPDKEEAMVAILTEPSKESASSSLLDLDLHFNLDTSIQSDLAFDQADPLMDMDIKEVITLTTINYNQLRIIKSSLLDLIKQVESAKEAIQGSRLLNNKERNNFSANFIYDDGSHIVTDRHPFYLYKEVNKVVHQGSAKSINIQGIGNIYIQFKDTGTKLLLRNVLHVPELEVNLINQSKMTNYYSLLIPTNIIIFNYLSSKIATIGDIINGLYHLPVQILHPHYRVFNTQTNTKESENKSQGSKP